MAIATNTTSGQQKKHEGGGLTKQDTQTEATRAGPAQNIVAIDAKGASTEQETVAKHPPNITTTAAKHPPE